MGMPDTRYSLVEILCRPGRKDAARSYDRALASFVRSYQGPVIAMCRRRGYGLQEAEDVFQEIMMKLIKSLPGMEIDREQTFRSLLATIVNRVLIDRYRAKKGEPLHLANQSWLAHLPDGSPSEELESELVEELACGAGSIVYQVRKRFAEKTWDVFVRVRLLNENARDVAKQWGIGTATVYQYCSRVTKAFHEAFESSNDR